MAESGKMKAKIWFAIGCIAALAIMFMAWEVWDWGVEGTSMGCTGCIIFGFVGAVFLLSFLIPIFILLRNLHRYLQIKEAESSSTAGEELKDISAANQEYSLSYSFRRPLQLVFSVFAGIAATFLVFMLAELLDSYYDGSRNLWFLAPFVFFGIIWWLLQIHNDSDTGKTRFSSNIILKRVVQFIFFILSGMGFSSLFTFILQMLPLHMMFGLHWYNIYGYFKIATLIIVAVVVWRLFVLHIKYEKQASAPPDTERMKWFVLINDKPVGPMTEMAVRKLLERGQIHEQTQVILSGMPEWLPVTEIDCFSNLPPSRPRQEEHPVPAPSHEETTEAGSASVKRRVIDLIILGVLLVTVVIVLFNKPFWKGRNSSGKSISSTHRDAYRKSQEIISISKHPIKYRETIVTFQSRETDIERLSRAVQENDIDTAFTLLFYYEVSAYRRDRAGMTPLHYAAQNNNFDMAKLLAAHRGSALAPNEKDKIPHQLLPRKADRNLRILLDGLRTGTRNDKDVPAHAIAKKGDLEKAKELHAKRELCLECMDDEAMTPLAIAVRNKRYDFVDWLLSQKVDVNYESSNIYANPLFGAILNDDSEMVAKLLEHGAFAFRQDDNKPPLIAAVNRCNTDIVKQLIDYGAIIDVRFRTITPLIAAKNHQCDKVEQFLLDQGAIKEQYYAAQFNDVKVMREIFRKHNQAFTGERKSKVQKLLSIALMNESHDVARFLVNNGADVNGGRCWLKNKHCDTPLQTAAGVADAEMIGYLLEKGADPNLDNGSEPPLYRLYNPEMPMEKIQNSFSVLLEHGADPFLVDEQGRAVLFHIQDIDFIKLFLDAGLDVSTPDHYGNTALHEVNDLKYVEGLILNGADPNAQNLFGFTPLDVAPYGDKADILIEYGGVYNIRSKYIDSTDTSVGARTIVPEKLDVSNMSQQTIEQAADKYCMHLMSRDIDAYYHLLIPIKKKALLVELRDRYPDVEDDKLIEQYLAREKQYLPHLYSCNIVDVNIRACIDTEQLELYDIVVTPEGCATLLVSVLPKHENQINKSMIFPINLIKHNGKWYLFNILMH